MYLLYLSLHHLYSWITCSIQIRRGKAWEIRWPPMTSGR